MCLTKKGQFGPDAIVGIVLVAVLGLGGILFLNTFVSGLALHGIISVLDSEIDQRCFYILLPLVGDEYSRAGEDVYTLVPFSNMTNYFGGNSQYSSVSYEFNNTINVFKTAVSGADFLKNLTNIEGYIASGKTIESLREKMYEKIGSNLTNYCSLPVYSPSGKLASAEIFIGET